MALQIGDTAPDFEAETTEGRIRFHDWIGDSWAVLFSHPKDFTPVCTTELGYMANIKPEFDRRGVKIIGLSVDSTGDHEGWAKDIEETQGAAPNYPIIGDSDFEVSKLYGMLPSEVAGDPKARTPADNQTVRNVFVIGPDKKVKLVLVYQMTTGRNFDEVLRVIDSLQLTVRHKVSTPVNWRQGDDEIIGRATEKAALLQTLEEGGPLVVFVHGIAGVGKSTLLGSFASEARSRGETVVMIDCRSIEPTERGFLNRLANAVGGAPASAEEAAERLAGLGERVVLVLDTYEVLRLLDSWVRLVFAAALHDNTRLVVAGREPPMASWHGAPGWSGLVRSVRLGNLDDGEAGELLTRAGLDAADARRVNRLARGHPLSLELAAAAVRDRPDVEFDDSALQAVLDELTGLYLDVGAI